MPVLRWFSCPCSLRKKLFTFYFRQDKISEHFKGLKNTLATEFDIANRVFPSPALVMKQLLEKIFHQYVIVPFFSLFNYSSNIYVLCR